MTWRFAIVLPALLMLAAAAVAQCPEQVPARNVGHDARPLAYMYRHRSLQHAYGQSQQTGRPLVVFVTSDNCAYCKKMLAETFSHPQIGRGVDSYTEPVVVNASDEPKIAKQLGVRAYPTTLVISREGKLLTRLQGFLPPQEFANRVWPVLQEDYAARTNQQQPAATVQSVSTRAPQPHRAASRELVSYRRGE